MRIVLATHHFSQPGGSETYLLTVAEQLARLGHETIIYANDLGQMAELAIARGIAIAPELDNLPATIDAILSQDGIVAHELSARFPETPHVFVSHSTIFELQNPPAIPGLVSAVVVLSDRFENYVRALATPHRIVRLRQPIDIERLSPVGLPRKQPRKALLLGNYLRGEQRRLIVETCKAAGIDVVQIGSTAGRFSMHPERDIAEADMVIGKGRAILDAMSCGRPAYICDVFGCDGWVTPDTYPLMEADAFAGLALPRVFDMDRLRRDLAEYDPMMGYANRELVMAHHLARTHAEKLVALIRDVSRAPVTSVTPKREMSRLIKAKWQAEVELYVLRAEMASQQVRAADADEQTALHARATSAANETIATLTAANEKARGEITALQAQIEHLSAELAAARDSLSEIASERAMLYRSRRVRVGLAFGRASDAIRRLRKRRK